MKEAMRKHEETEQKNLKINPKLRKKMKHEKFLDKKKSSKESEKEKYGKPNQLQNSEQTKIKWCFFQSWTSEKEPKFIQQFKKFLQIILPKPDYLKSKATTEIISY